MSELSRIRVKNKILEQLDESIRDEYYKLLETDAQLVIGNEHTPPNYNVIKCGSGFIITNPLDEQLPYCEGRVLSLYNYYPFIRDDAEEFKKMEKEKALQLLQNVNAQYDPTEVYEYMMQGLENKTLYNIFDDQIIEEYHDKESGKSIMIFEVYHKDEWKSYSLMVYGNKPNSMRCIAYDSDKDKEKAMKFFAGKLSGENKKFFQMLPSQQAMEAE